MILSVLENGGRREYPVSDVLFDRECDLLCVGIGSAGGYAALAAAREGLKVIAVEKGTNQMKAPLRFDPRIELHEKQDIFEFVTDENIDVILADVSFVSLKKVLAYAKKNLAGKNTEFLVMLKPQFEAPDYMLRRGVLKNNKMRREIIVNFEAWLKDNGFLIVGKKDNEVAGRFGNVERFYYLKIVK